MIDSVKIKRHPYETAPLIQTLISSHFLSTCCTINVTNSINTSMCSFEVNITRSCATMSKYQTHFLKSTDNHEVTSLSSRLFSRITASGVDCWKTTSPLRLRHRAVSPSPAPMSTLLCTLLSSISSHSSIVPSPASCVLIGRFQRRRRYLSGTKKRAGSGMGCGL